MDQTMEEYHSTESEEQRSWDWSKAVRAGKKVLTAGVVVSSAPLLVPPLFVVSTFAFLSSIPFCFFLANYACTQKIMSSLLPPTDEVDGVENEESGFEYKKLGHGEGEGVDEVGEAMNEATPIQIEDDEEMAKESTSLLEKIREEGRTDRDISEKADGEKSQEVQVQTTKQEKTETGHEGELGDKTSETSKDKDDKEASSNEVYSEDQIWEKMETLRKIVGYNVARSATYTEELKALFVFTGVVEPTRSSLNPRDIHDIANVTLRLRFLMSVIGIN